MSITTALGLSGSKKNWAAMAVALCGIAGFAGVAHADNILVNGGFETQGTGDATTAAGWTFTPQGIVTPVQAGRDTNDPETGSFDAHLVVSGSAAGGADVANLTSNFDTTGPATVVPGTLYTSTFDTTGTFGPGSVLNTFIDFYNSTGGLLARDLKEGGYTTSSAGYLTHTISDTAPTGAAYYDLFFNFVTGAFDGASGDISIDNATFNSPGTSVPEPASLSLLALGAAGLLVRRRKA